MLPTDNILVDYPSISNSTFTPTSEQMVNMTLLQTVEDTSNMQRHCELALLAKLQEMVPIMPRERELSKLEIINYVIDYIRHLKELVDVFDK